jgi:hypothetical protein
MHYALHTLFSIKNSPISIGAESRTGEKRISAIVAEITVGCRLGLDSLIQESHRWVLAMAMSAGQSV